MPILNSRPLLFPTKYIAAGIFGIGLMVFFQSSSLDTDSSIQVNPYHLILMFYYYASWVLLIKYVNGTAFKIPQLKDVGFKEILIFVFSGLLIVTIHFTISNLAYYLTRIALVNQLFSPWDELNQVFVPAMLSRLVDFMVIAGILKFIQFNRELQEKNLKLAEVETQLTQSHLATLKAQLNPHFLFNSLHAVSTLIGYDDEKACNMTIKISGLLRKMLEDRDKHIHTLKEELSYIEDYLDIERERFHDRLEITMDVPEDSLPCEVPNLLLQPLIENAFKHGISQLENGGSISISSELSEQKLLIHVNNSCPVSTTNEGSTGLGIENLRNRLYQLYGTTATLEVKQNDTHFHVELLIPQ